MDSRMIRCPGCRFILVNLIIVLKILFILKHIRNFGLKGLIEIPWKI